MNNDQVIKYSLERLVRDTDIDGDVQLAAAKALKVLDTDYKSSKNTYFAKKLMMYVAGMMDEEEYRRVCVMTVDAAWDKLQPWEKDDYISASIRFTKLICETMENT